MTSLIVRFKLCDMANEVNPVGALQAFIGMYESQREAADALGVTGAFLSHMLAGKSPVSPKVLARLGLKRVVVKAGKVA